MISINEIVFGVYIDSTSNTITVSSRFSFKSASKLLFSYHSVLCKIVWHIMWFCSLSIMTYYLPYLLDL